MGSYRESEGGCKIYSIVWGKMTIEEEIRRIEQTVNKMIKEAMKNCTMEDNMSNIVQVRFLQDPFKKRYTFNVPCNEKICKGDVVRIRNKNDSEMIAIAETNSEMLSENAIDMIMGGKEVISWVIGKYKYDEFLNLNITTETITISNDLTITREDFKDV